MISLFAVQMNEAQKGEARQFALLTRSLDRKTIENLIEIPSDDYTETLRNTIDFLKNSKLISIKKTLFNENDENDDLTTILFTKEFINNETIVTVYRIKYKEEREE